MWALLSGYKTYFSMAMLVGDALGGLMGWWEPDTNRYIVEGGVGAAALRHAFAKMKP